MRRTLLILALLLTSCSRLTAPPVPDAVVAGAPAMVPRGSTEYPTRSVELKNLRTALVTAHWFDELQNDDGYYLAPASGPAIEFSAELDLHGWDMARFYGNRHGEDARWSIGVEIDTEGDGLYDGFWDYDSYFTNSFWGVAVRTHDREDIKFERERYHVADLVMSASDADSLKGRGHLRFSIPLADVNLTRGPVRWKIYADDTYNFPIEQHIGITGDGVNVPTVIEWKAP